MNETLSDQICDGYEEYDFEVIPVRKVKEFIRKLRAKNCIEFNKKGILTLIQANENINELVGDKLI